MALIISSRDAFPCLLYSFFLLYFDFISVDQNFKTHFSAIAIFEMNECRPDRVLNALELADRSSLMADRANSYSRCAIMRISFTHLYFSPFQESNIERLSDNLDYCQVAPHDQTLPLLV